MKILFLLPLILSLKVLASSPYVVYGDDNRSEPYEKPEKIPASKAVAAMVAKNALHLDKEGRILYEKKTLQKTYMTCEGQRFNDQNVLANCTGFLIAPDVIVTAGHCINNDQDCENFFWVFGYELEYPGQKDVDILPENIYSCSSIIARSYGTGSPDYAVIKLSTPTDREPLKLSQKGEVLEGQKIFMMGHPNGIPLKITDQAEVLRTDKNFIITNLDAFHVNSGSPVLDEKSGLVIGILVKGKTDYKMGNLCAEINVLDESQGGEKVTSVKFLPEQF